MHSFIVFTAFCLALAGRATAFLVNFTDFPNIPNPHNLIGNFTPSKLIVNSSVQFTNCNSACTPASSAIETCGDNNATCVCDPAVFSLLQQCEQCMFTNLIEMNQGPPEPSAGSANVLSTFAASCAVLPPNGANITIPANLTTLVLPTSWVGPTDLILNTGETVVALILGAVIGSGAIGILCTM